MMLEQVPKTKPVYPARRQVFCSDALGWLAAHAAQPATSVVTSIPDFSEIPSLSLSAWQDFFMGAARQILTWIPEDGVVVFFQSDVRHAGQWLDKGYLIMKAAEETGAFLHWHKIVCRRPPGTIAQGRPSFSHMICLSRRPFPPAQRPGPDVLPDAGYMPWPRAMGERACEVACRYLRDETPTRLIVDPFCGEGSLLAVANNMGFSAIGIDLSPRRCRLALAQTLERGKKASQQKQASLLEQAAFKIDKNV